MIESFKDNVLGEAPLRDEHTRCIAEFYFPGILAEIAEDIKNNPETFTPAPFREG